jgi:hypothetical protein
MKAIKKLLEEPNMYSEIGTTKLKMEYICFIFAFAGVFSVNMIPIIIYLFRIKRKDIFKIIKL